MARDRRSARRARVIWPVTLETLDGRFAAGEVVDASPSGMRVRGAPDLPVGSAVTARVTLPEPAGTLEVMARVARRAPEGVALDFVGLPTAEARRVQRLLAPWEARRRSPRVPLQLGVSVEGGSIGTRRGATQDLSTFGARVAIDRPLAPGEDVTLELAPADGGAPLRLPAVVWDADARGTVLLFVNLPEADFRRLDSYLSSLLGRPA